MGVCVLFFNIFLSNLDTFLFGTLMQCEVLEVSIKKFPSVLHTGQAS